MSEISKTAFLCMVFFVIGLALGAYEPIDVLRLEGAASGVRATVQKKILGVLPLSKETIHSVIKASLVETPHDIGFDNASTILLESRKAELVYTHFAWIRPEQEVARINDYIRDPGERPLVTWRPNWPYTLISGFLVIGSVIYLILQFWQSLQNSLF